MHVSCGWVRDRLVAFADGELSPGEQVRTEEHLRGCAGCQELDAHLRFVTPRPSLVIPPEVLARMATAVDEAVDRELDAPITLPEPTPLGRIGSWLRRERDVSNGAMLAYAMVLAACLGLVLSNWLTPPDAQPVATFAPANPATFSSDDYEPASFSPDEADEGWR